MNFEHYYTILKTKIINQITCDLTIGREDNDLEPYSKEVINNFIQENNNNIEKVINSMITDYNEDDDIESLNQPENDWICEYLYEYVDTSSHM